MFSSSPVSYIRPFGTSIKYCSEHLRQIVTSPEVKYRYNKKVVNSKVYLLSDAERELSGSLPDDVAQACI